MRTIALLCEGVDPDRGGAQRAVLATARAIAACGHRAQIVGPGASRAVSLAVARWPEPSRAGIAGIDVPLPARGRARSIRLLASAAAECATSAGATALVATGKLLGAHALWSHSGTHSSSVAAALEASRAGGRAFPGLAALAKRLAPRQAAFRQIERDQLHALRDGRLRPLALSRAMRDELARLSGLSADRIAIVPNGVDATHFRPARDPSERARERAWLARHVHRSPDDPRPLALFVAHHPELKGLAPLLRSLAEPPATSLGVALLVAGDPGPRRLARLARRLGIAESVAFLGPRPDADALYRGADLLAHPTFRDPCSLVTLEALASGLPVVTTRRNGAADAMTNGREGVVLEDPADHRAIAAAIARIASDPSQRDAMGLAARELALRCSWARTADLLLDALGLPAERIRT